MSRILQDFIVRRVRAVFNDRSGQQPLERRPDGLFGPDSVAWRVHGDVTSMMVGGIAALLMQMLHPAVLAGVWDHSNFRHDMLGRFRRTARFVAVTTYGSREEAEAAIDHVRQVHHYVRGLLPDSTPYNANDPELLKWVHTTEAYCFLGAWVRFAELGMSRADKDRYYREVAQVASMLGAPEVPMNGLDLHRYVQAMKPRLLANGRTREVARILLSQSPASLVALPLQQLTFQSAVDLLPSWARQMHGLQASTLTRPLVYTGTLGIARSLRWAFGPR